MSVARNDSLGSISALFGWTYFLAWICIQYPQPLLNYRRKHVEGLSIDFVAMSVFGQVSYLIYTLTFLLNTEVREEYRRRHHDHANVVEINDAAFALHATLLTSFTMLQTLYYPRRDGQRLSTYGKLILSIVAVTLIAQTSRVALLKTSHTIDLIYLFGNYKLCSTLLKYTFQAWENYVRKSTVGWSIYFPIFDIVGGTFSLLQLLVDAARARDWTALSGNFAKLAIALVSLTFDAIFVIQHYVLYPGRKDEESEDSPKPAGPQDDEEQAPLLSSSQ